MTSRSRPGASAGGVVAVVSEVGSVMARRPGHIPARSPDGTTFLQRAWALYRGRNAGVHDRARIRRRRQSRFGLSALACLLWTAALSTPLWSFLLAFGPGSLRGRPELTDQNRGQSGVES